MRIVKSRGLRKVALVMAGVLLAACAADAGPRKKHRQPARAERSNQNSLVDSPRYAEIVVDAKTGKVLREKNADSPRYPASITKIMTAYLAFEELTAKRMDMSTRLEVSGRCAAMAPSKLGLKPGSTIALEDALLAIITKSANDVACTIGENIAGSEASFAERMTRTARRIGMSNTTYRNASGLPNPGQLTTARDQATLGRAIQERFPSYYRLFSTRSFAYRGDVYGNHNRLLGRVEGVDGIKTGYTRASGFNLVTSAKMDGRHIVGVVLGGSSGGARDARMASLVENYIQVASAGPRTSSVLARNDDEAPVKVASNRPVDVERTLAPTPRVAMPQEVAPTINTRILQPVAPVRAATGAPMPLVQSYAAPEAARAPIPAPAPVKPVAPARVAEQAGDADPIVTASLPRREQGATAARQQAAAAVPSAPRREAATAVAAPVPAARAASGWVIQIGAFDTIDQARGKLAKVRGETGKLLADASPATETVAKGNKTLVRARFTGFDDRDAAQAACSALKRRAIDCLAVHQ
ncbi:MAG: D-alanyl-D-alanine carboxypeptidase [Hyphomicrobiaceae bacterium]|nr:D-alanyl-D-alanine carboxypeptidase [Hyphomicrobiaceae bacterium]